MSKDRGNSLNSDYLSTNQMLKESVENKENLPQFKTHRRNSSMQGLNFSESQVIQKQSPLQSDKRSFHVSNFSTNTQFSTITFERNSSDTESVVYLGNKDIQVKLSQDLKESQEVSTNRLQVQEFNLSMSADSLERSQMAKSALKSKNSKLKSGSSTFRLSVSGDLSLPIPSILSSQQQISNLKQLRSSKNLEQDQETSKKHETTVTAENSSDLFLFCSQCKGIQKAELFSQKQSQKWKSDFLNIITDIVCCFNKSKTLKKAISKTGFRCLTCKNFNVMLNDMKMES